MRLRLPLNSLCSLICMGRVTTQIPAVKQDKSSRAWSSRGDRGFRCCQRSCVLKVAHLDNAVRPVGVSVAFIRDCVLRCVKASKRASALWHQDEGPHRHSHKYNIIIVAASHRLGRRLIISARKRKRRQSISIFLNACASNLLASLEFFRKSSVDFEKRIGCCECMSSVVTFFYVFHQRARNSIDNYVTN